MESSAFKNSEHLAASTLAVNTAAPAAPDVAKFKDYIIGWSYGVDLWGTGIGGNPSEQLAHVGDQRRSIFSVYNNQGNYQQFLNRIDVEFQRGNYIGTTPGHEGAYILMGSCLHLVEDQASPPHAANVLHQAADHFEGPIAPSQQLVSVSITTAQGNTESRESMYAAAIALTQSRIDQLGPWPQYWTRNDQLYQQGDHTKNQGRYVGQYPVPPLGNFPGDDGVDPQFTGAYDGGFGDDTFSQTAVPTLYGQQGTQATDFAYNLLLKFSQSFPPVASGLKVGDPVTGNNNVDGVNPTQIAFSVIDNSKSSLNIDVYIKETGQRIVSKTATISILVRVSKPLCPETVPITEG